MARQVVDELVVALRLDDSQFDRAVADAIAARQKLADETEKATKKEGDSLGAVAGRYLKWAAVLALMKKVSDEVVKVADGLLDLSVESRRLGMSASGLRTWQNAIEMLGGKAGEATSEVGKFIESLNNLVYKGEVGDNLQWLARLGVPVRRGMTYEETAPQVFAAIKKGRASGTIKDDQEAAFIARQAGFGIVGDYIAQRPTATQEDFRGFVGSARSRAIDEGNAASGAQAMRSIIQAGQKLQQTKEGIVGQHEKTISAAAEVAGATKNIGWEIGEAAVTIGEAVVTIVKKAADKSSRPEGKSGVVVNYPFGDYEPTGRVYYTDAATGKVIPDDEARRRISESRKRDEEERKAARSGKIIRSSGGPPKAGEFFSRGVSVPPPTPGASTDNSRSSNITINQTNNIRSTEPAAAGREVASRTRKEIVGLSDGAAQ